MMTQVINKMHETLHKNAMFEFRLDHISKVFLIYLIYLSLQKLISMIYTHKYIETLCFF